MVWNVVLVAIIIALRLGYVACRDLNEEYYKQRIQDRNVTKLHTVGCSCVDCLAMCWGCRRQGSTLNGAGLCPTCVNSLDDEKVA